MARRGGRRGQSEAMARWGAESGPSLRSEPGTRGSLERLGRGGERSGDARERVVRSEERPGHSQERIARPQERAMAPIDEGFDGAPAPERGTISERAIAVAHTPQARPQPNGAMRY